MSVNLSRFSYFPHNNQVSLDTEESATYNVQFLAISNIYHETMATHFLIAKQWHIAPLPLAILHSYI